MATTLLVVKNRAYSKLAAAIDDDDTSLTVTAGEGSKFPSTYPFHLTIEDEIVSCTARSTDTLTIARAQQSTSAAAHANNKKVHLNITAKSITDLNTAVNTIEDEYIHKDGSVAFTGAQAFGVDAAGVRVDFFGDTSGSRMVWSDSENKLYFIGLANIHSVGTGMLNWTGDVGIGASLTVIGNCSFQGATVGVLHSITVNENVVVLGNIELGGTLRVVGTSTLDGNVALSGAVTQGFAMTATSGGEEAFKLTITDDATQTSGMNRAFVVDLTVSGAKSDTAHSEAGSLDLTLSGNTNTAYGLGIWVTDSGGADHVLTEGLNIYLENMGAGTLGAIVGLDIGINSTNLATGRHAALRMRNHSGTAKTGILFEGAFTTGIDLGGIGGGGIAGLYTRGIDFSGGTYSVAEIDLDFGKIIFDQDGDTDIHCDVDDELDFKLSGSNFVIMAAGVLRPGTTNQVDLGSSSKQFKDLYLSGDVSIGGTTTALTFTSAATIVAASGLTMPAFTLGGAITLNGQVFDAGSGSAKFVTTGASSGLQIVANYDDNLGAGVRLYTNSASPAVDDRIGTFLYYGNTVASNGNPADTERLFGAISCRAPVVIAMAEEAKFTWFLRDAGAWNEAMTLSGAGVLTLDHSLKFDQTVDSVAVANEVSLSGYDIDSTHRVLAISCEEAVVTEAVGASDRSLRVRINGATYKLMLVA